MERDRPTGTVSFLFTDVEGSTKLWEDHPETARRSLARHDEILREVIARHRGYVFSTAGDAFSAAFWTDVPHFSMTFWAPTLAGAQEGRRVGAGVAA